MSIKRRISRNPINNVFKKLKIFLLTLSFFIGLSQGAMISRINDIAQNYNQCSKQCHSNVCGEEALRFAKYMNDQVDPCSNFYDFACGLYIKNKSMNDTDNIVAVTKNAQNDINYMSMVDLNEEVSKSDLEAFKKTKIYYQNCMNQARIERAGTRPLMEILDAIGGWPVIRGNRWDERKFDLMQSIHEIRKRNFPEFFPVMIIVDFDNIDSAKYTIKVQNAKLNVDRAFFTDNDRNKILKPFLHFMTRVATILGANNDYSTLREMQQVVDFEVNLYNIATPEEKLINLPVDKSRMTIGDLSYKYPNIPWLDFINKILNRTGLSVNESETVYVIDPDFLSGVVRLLENTPKRVLANFIAWRTAQQALPYMSKILSDVENNFKKIVEGTKAVKSKKESCFDDVMETFPISMSAMFIRNHFKDIDLGPVFELFENLRHQTRKNLEEIDWMDSITRQAALEKLDAMSITMGYAKELMDDRKVDEFYHELDINPGLFIESALNASHFSLKKNFKNLRRSANEDQWTLKQNVVYVNAYNVVQKNNIEMPAGFLKAFYHGERPQYMNYGILGTIIGHEVFHAFDNIGRQYDKYGNQINWWKSNTEDKFKRKAQCIINQYNDFTIPEIHLKVNGELSQSENIADNGGFRAAYLAYNEWAKRNNIEESCLPSLNYTPQQMFWISAASVWCSKERPEYLRQLITTDPHSPSIARVIISFSNIQEFADAFKCQVGSKMNPSKKCHIW